jgi:sugar phosphate isomerase/epimerase
MALSNSKFSNVSPIKAWSCDIVPEVMARTLSTRRAFLATAASLPLAAKMANSKVPVGLELYSVRNELAKDQDKTLRAVAKMGYQCVEFFAPYYKWDLEHAKSTRKLLDDLGMRCYSTHNDRGNFEKDKIGHAIELNQILGARYIVMASSGEVSTLDGWKRVAQTLQEASDTLAPHHLEPGYHNHELEFMPIGGVRPIEVIAKNTSEKVMLQLDVGTCIDAGSDPVAWIEKNPGRIRSIHCKDWSRSGGYKVLFGEGSAPWKKIFQAAENGGGVEYYLIEQEGSRYPALETAAKCLKSFKKIHGA